MKSDFDLIIHSLPAAPEVKLFFVGDLHIGAIEANHRAWEYFCDNVLADPAAYLCILGDMMNNATRSSVSSVFDDAMSQFPRPSEQKKYLVNQLKPLAPRILCIVPGNHEGRSTKDADDEPLYDVAAKLDLEEVYRPNCAFMKICIGSRDAGRGYEKPLQIYTAAVTHGAGGGIYTGAAVNRNERMAMFVDTDILAVGHTHKGAITKPSRIHVDTYANTVSQRSITVVSACSWMSYGGYALRKMLLPSSAQDPECPQTVIIGGLRDKRFIKTVW